MKKVDPQTSKGPADWFTGDVYPTIVLAGEEPSRVRMGSVHFAPCARTAWHSHALGQYLHITEGTALLQERGGEVVTLKPGDTIYTAPGIEHWHGANAESFMVHLAIWEAPGDGSAETTWGDHVSDEEYTGGRIVSEQLHVLVIGATGSIGRLVVRNLLERGIQTKAFSRDVSKAERLLGTGVDVVQGDVTNLAELTAALEGVDAVVMTHGAPYGSGSPEAVDYGAVPRLLEALDGREVRVALMSSIGVTGTGGSSRDLLNWKRRGERLLRASGLPYTIVRPGWFDAGTGSEQRIDLRQGDQIEHGPVRREHVAEVLAQSILTNTAIGRTLEVFSSDGSPITDWSNAFAVLRADEAGGLDGAADRASVLTEREPLQVLADLDRWTQRR